ALVEALKADQNDENSAHDMGGNIITTMTESGDVGVYDFCENRIPGATERDRAYWRDVGTLDSYYAAQMDLVSVHPIFNLYNHRWQIHTYQGSQPPAKFVFDEDGRRGTASDSLISSGVIVSGATVRRSVLSPEVFVHSHAKVEDSVILDDVDIGRGAVIKKAIIDKNVVIPAGCKIGIDPEHDRARGFTVSAEGVTVIGKGDEVKV
ncbi:MAG: glucose-1-phosphate adenylyltransferase, partial [Deltaproteobacteria bacterium]|nr:glucose-1-phosphate adenylyltransferase [Deltaproteobacteria bacterium]